MDFLHLISQRKFKSARLVEEKAAAVVLNLILMIFDPGVTPETIGPFPKPNTVFELTLNELPFLVGFLGLAANGKSELSPVFPGAKSYNILPPAQNIVSKLK